MREEFENIVCDTDEDKRIATATCHSYSLGREPWHRFTTLFRAKTKGIQGLLENEEPRFYLHIEEDIEKTDASENRRTFSKKHTERIAPVSKEAAYLWVKDNFPKKFAEEILKNLEENTEECL